LGNLGVHSQPVSLSPFTKKEEKIISRKNKLAKKKFGTQIKIKDQHKKVGVGGRVNCI
jgi:hypothetical protein